MLDINSVLIPRSIIPFWLSYVVVLVLRYTKEIKFYSNFMMLSIILLNCYIGIVREIKAVELVEFRSQCDVYGGVEFTQTVSPDYDYIITCFDNSKEFSITRGIV